MVTPHAPSSRAVRALPAELSQFRKVFTSTTFETEHPVVRVHPETGERVPLLGNFVRRLTGLRGSGSRALINVLTTVTAPPTVTTALTGRQRRDTAAPDIPALAGVFPAAG